MPDIQDTSFFKTLPPILAAFSKGFPAQAKSEDALNVMRLVAKFRYPAKDAVSKMECLAFPLLQHAPELTRVSQDTREKTELAQAAGVLLALPVAGLDPAFKYTCTLLSEESLFKGVILRQHAQVSGDGLQISFKAIDKDNKLSSIVPAGPKSLWSSTKTVPAPTTVAEFEILCQQLRDDFQSFTDKFCRGVRQEKRALEAAMLEKGFTQAQIDLVKSFW